MAANLYNFSYPKRYTTLLALATNYRWGRLKAQEVYSEPLFRIKFYKMQLREMKTNGRLPFYQLSALQST